MAFGHSLRIYLSCNAHHAGDITGLGLCSRHATEAGGNEEHSGQFTVFAMTATGVENSDSSTVYNTLRTDIHIRPGCHLTILAHAKRIETLPVVGLGIVGHNHAVCHHHTRRTLRRRKQTERMPRVHHEGLSVGHLAEIFHRQAVLCPVLEHGSIAAVGNQFMWMLGHGRVEVVLYHHHDCRSLTRPGWVLVDRPGIHFVVGPIAVHVDTAVATQFVGKLRGKLCVERCREVAQSITQGEAFFVGRENFLTLGCMVDRGVVRFG